MCVRQHPESDDVSFFDLVDLFTNKLGGPHCVTPWERINLVTAAALQACADDVRSNLPTNATAGQHLAVVQIEEIAEAAVTALRLPCHEYRR
jgi:hypothetical protein